MTTLVTVSDDRMGRKGGLYEATQKKIEVIMRNNIHFEIDKVKSWTWTDIVQTDFYAQNKVLLDNIDAGRNGRAYKPFVILEALKESDFVIYNDCSPEMWSMHEDFHINPAIFDVKVIKELTERNGGILNAFVKWDNKHIGENELGAHIHKLFTMDRCINKMGMQAYLHSYMGASGMFCFVKNDDTIDFVEEWLRWNLDPECACLGKPEIENDYSYRLQEENKLGHRHDQSIVGLLLNKRNANLVDIVYNNINPYNFINFCRIGVNYKFIPSNSRYITYNSDIDKGDYVTNEQGVRLKVFDVVLRDGIYRYRVGINEASTYETTRGHLIK